MRIPLAVLLVLHGLIHLLDPIPAKLRGASEAISVLEESPHSLFWDYDAVGYISMGSLALVAVPALSNIGTSLSNV